MSSPHSRSIHTAQSLRCHFCQAVDLGVEAIDHSRSTRLFSSFAPNARYLLRFYTPSSPSPLALPASLYAFVTLSVVSSGIRELHEAIDGARCSRFHGYHTILFVKEIHQFSKSQQDSFLLAIEDGSIILIGATTKNPFFQLTTPLLSRCSILALQPLKPQHIKGLLHRAISVSIRAYSSQLNVQCRLRHAILLECLNVTSVWRSVSLTYSSTKISCCLSSIYKEAKRVIRESKGPMRIDGVPLHLRNAPMKLMKDMEYDKDYMYPPDHKDCLDCSSQTYLPLSLLGHKFLDWLPNDEKQE
ncbi:hypothetical protein ZIOFF_037573 [Zingiber officinale]|uniref:MgsA AAA+ ATPase C-terminal domain-containing protein n=1 Tax=Zingiber officinale TaxID=94328 RepID=A0A8J5GJU6_ZINOF|nr:hypothetical protein ZIOFF_037573 [Zingiber officinale]